ncbi:MAG: response regulator [Bacillota bacterium]|nr:response regulator [Bacillota bacterium]
MMYKMIIADDEAFSRDAFKMIINKRFPEIKIVAEAQTGREAIEMFSEFNPNLMIMDIKMPGINGLQAISEIKKMNPETRFIVLTAYDYFKYATEALSLDVDDYILKPARKEKIIEAVKKVLNNIEEAKNKKNMELELKEKLNNILPVLESEFALSMVFGDMERIRQMNYPALLGKSFNTGYSMVLDFNETTEDKTKDLIKNELYIKVKDIVTMFLNARISDCIIGPVFSGRIAVFFPEDGINDIKETRNLSIDIGRGIVKKIQEELDVRPLIGIGGTHKGIEGLIESYSEANIAVNSKRLIVSHFDNLENNTDISSYSLKLERMLCERIRQRDKEEALETFKELYFDIIEWDIVEILRKMSELMSILTRILLEFEKEDQANLFFHETERKKLFILNSKQEIYDWCRSKVQQIVNLLCESRVNDTEDDVIISAVKYIEANFMREITLEDVARAVNVSPFYLSKLFKSEMNQNFIDFLTYLRVDAAKKRIPDPNMSIKEICYQVGYNDPNYFTRVFKKVTGLTPLEYRQANKNTDRLQ